MGVPKPKILIINDLCN